MKRGFVLFLLVFLTLCCTGCIAESACWLYSSDGKINGFYVAVNETANCCFVGTYTCEEYAENQEITIPDEFDGKPIKRIGGTYGSGVPSPFSISVASLYMNASEDSEYGGIYHGDLKDFNIAEEYRVEDVCFVLNIGKNIETIEFVDMDEYYPHINEDGSITFYHPVVYVKCAEDNPYFYSKDGKLYDKKTDALISQFAYAAN